MTDEEKSAWSHLKEEIAKVVALMENDKGGIYVAEQIEHHIDLAGVWAKEYTRYEREEQRRLESDHHEYD